MKIDAGILIAIYLCALIGVLADFVSATSYEWLFLISSVMAITSISGCTFAYSRWKRWRFVLFPPFVLALYAITDVGLRYFAGERILDVFS